MPSRSSFRHCWAWQLITISLPSAPNKARKKKNESRKILLILSGRVFENVCHNEIRKHIMQCMDASFRKLHWRRGKRSLAAINPEASGKRNCERGFRWRRVNSCNSRTKLNRPLLFVLTNSAYQRVCENLCFCHFRPNVAD